MMLPKRQFNYYSLLIFGFVQLINFIHGAPVQYCVEETKDRKLVGGTEPYSEGATKDERQCVASCVKDKRAGVTCKAAVFISDGGLTKNNCLKYAKTYKETGAQLVKTQVGTISYYELLDECPPNRTIASLLQEKRRDPGLNEVTEDEQINSHPFANPPMNNPPQQKVVANDVGAGYGNQMQTYQVQPSQTGNSGCCSPPQTTSCCQVQVQIQPMPQPCCPAPQPACCSAPQPAPCCPPPQPAPCCPAPQPSPCCQTPPPPPLQWGPWAAWSECQQVPCAPGGGGGTMQTRTRQCQGYGGGCQGESQQQQPCGCLQGQWTEWGPPSSCSVTCGGGTQSKTRTCTVPDTCPGPSTDQSSCGEGSCAHWAEWGTFQQCSASCGQGTQTRQRSCIDFQGGVAQGCPGDDSAHQACPSLPPCCQDWTAWSQCSATCGQGTQTRTKTCEGGVGSQTEQQPCSNSQPCCSQWTAWSTCQVQCGQGYQTRTRTCGGSGSYGGPGLGLPSIGGSSSGGCCNTKEQQTCSSGGCSQNSYYQPQYNNFYQSRG